MTQTGGRVHGVDWLAAVVDASDECFLLLDLDGRAVQQNQATTDRFGRELAGADFFAEVSGDLGVRRKSAFSEAVALQRPVSFEEVDQRRTWEVDVRLVPGDDDGPVGVLMRFRPLADRRASQPMAARHFARLRRAEVIAEHGYCVFSAGGADLELSAGAKKLWGFRDGETPMFHELLARIHPDDVEQVSSKFQSDGTEFEELRYRVVRPDESTIVVRCAGTTEPATSDEPARYFRSMTDVTEEHEIRQVLRQNFEQDKVARESLLESERRLAAVVDNITDALLTVGTDGIIRWVNQAAARMFLCPQSRLVGMVANVLWAGDADAHTDAGYVQGMRQDGSVFPMEMRVDALVTDAEALGLVVLRDVSERFESDRIKEEFVSTVSHELRTPLTSIKGALGLAMSGSLGEVPEKMERMLVVAGQNTHRLIDLVNDLLDMEKLASNGMDFDMQTVDLTELVAKSVDDNQSYALDRDVALKFDNLNFNGTILGDRLRLEQVLANLISNAAKFSPVGGEVRISIEHQDESVRISVADDGPGISEEHHERIFERFVQADSSDTRRAGGTGLGLAISEAIVERHGGSISFDTEVGVGSTFYFILPVKQSPEKGRDSSHMEAGTETSLARGELFNARLLLVGVDPEFGHELEEALKALGTEVSTVANTEGAGDALTQADYTLVIVDIDDEGDERLRFATALAAASEVRGPRVVVTSRVGLGDMVGEQMPTRDMVGWLPKPVEIDCLKATLRQVMSPNLKADGPVLIVEDDDDLAEVIVTTLPDNVSCIIASSLAEAMRVIDEREVGAVLLDVGLPDGNGLDLIPILTERDGPHTPIIVFTGASLDVELNPAVDAAMLKSRTSIEAVVEVIVGLLDRPTVAER